MKKQLIRYIVTAFGIVSVGYASSLQAQSTVMFENFLPSVIETNLRNQTFWEPLKMKIVAKLPLALNQI